MRVIDPEVITHELNVDIEFQPIKQKRRNFISEKNQIVNKKVKKVESNDLIKEIQYLYWLANVVLVRTKNGKPRVCIDFTKLNKVYMEDNFLLPMIDTLVDATTDHKLMSFLYAYARYNQIFMHPDDQENTSFITEIGIYCYKVMPFGPKNANATYQRLVNKMFK